MQSASPTEFNSPVLQGLAQVLWSAESDDIVKWCATAIDLGQLADFDPDEASKLLAKPPKGTRDAISRLRLLALALLEQREYRLQALVWKACAARGMEPRNVNLRLLDALTALNDWAGIIVCGGFLLSQPDPRPHWTKITKDAVAALLGDAPPPSRDNLMHVLRHTGLRFIGDILDRLGDSDPVQVFLGCEPTDAQLLQLSVTFGHRNQPDQAAQFADSLAAQTQSTTYKALARAARDSAAGLLDGSFAALAEAGPPPPDLPAMALWNWAAIAAACGHPSLSLLAQRIVADPVALGMLGMVLADMGPNADESGSLQAALIESGADPLALLDIRLSSGETLGETDAKEAMALVEADKSDLKTDRIVALTRALLDRSQLSAAAVAVFCRKHSGALCTNQTGANLLARALTVVQDWQGSLVALDALLRQTPDATWALSKSYFAAAKLGRADLAQSYLSRIDLAGPANDAALLTVAHGACILADFDLGRRVLDQIPAHVLVADVFNLAGRLRAVLAGDASGLHRGENVESERPKAALPPRVLVIDPGFAKNAGHHFGYTLFSMKFFASELGAKPEEIWVCARRGEPWAESIDDAQIESSLHRVFDFNPYTFEDFPKTDESLKNLSIAWEADLTRGLQDSDLGQVEVIYCHSMKANLAVGFAKWVESHFNGKPVLVVIGVIEVDYLSEGKAVSQACNASYSEAVQILRKISGIHLIFYAETAFACSNLSTALEEAIPVHNIPYLAASLAGPASATQVSFSKSVVTIGLVGGSRRDRGLDIFPELMLALSDRSDVRWILQMSRGLAEQVDPVFPSYLDWAVSNGICTWYSERMESDAYFEALRQMDVVLMPYRDRYAVSGSGVFYEALQLERYLIVPQATFMHDVLVELDYPSSFVSGTSVALVMRAITKMLKEKSNLRNDMLALRKKKGELLPLGKFRSLCAAGLSDVKSSA